MSNAGPVADRDPATHPRRIRRLAALLLLLLAIELAGLALVGTGSGPALSAGEVPTGSVAGGEFVVTSTVTALPGCSGPGPLLPGVDRCLTYTVHNLLRSPITVTAISIAGVTAPAGCAPSNLDLDRTAFAGALEVPAGGMASAPGVPIALRETGINQDACKGVSFGLTLTGRARHGPVVP